jgi:predicted amidohydrolase YtcJ
VNQPADIVITGADVYCGDPAGTWAGAVAVRGERIVAVGSETEVRDRVGSAVNVLHLPGRMVVAGFQDAHVHPPTAGRNRLTVSLNEITGRRDYLDAVALYAAANPDEPWIVGGGWAMEYFPGGTPSKDDLDAIVGDRPVFLFNRDVHGAWVNSKALEMGGITNDTPNPPDGWIERDPRTGEATGTLHEGAAYSFNDHVVPMPDQGALEAALLNAQAHLHSLGITGWQDAWVTPETETAYRAIAASGQLTARVVGALWWDRHRGLDQVADMLARREAGSVAGAGSFHPTSVKIMIDGVLENFTGALLEPYCDGSGGHTDNAGLAYLDRAELAEAVTALDRHGFQVHMHAIGDRAVRNALDAVAAARPANGVTDNRHHIAHIQLVTPQDRARFSELGVVANCQTYWAQMEPQMEQLTIPFLGRDRADQQYPFADLVRSGGRLAMGSDWSVTTANPLEQMEVAVNRIDPDNRSNLPFLPGQRLTLAQAVSGFTLGSAYVNHDDEESGSIEVGKRADLAVLDRNVFTAPVTHLSDASVELTLSSGRVVFERREHATS